MNEMVEAVAMALFDKHHQDKLDLIASGKISRSMSGIEYFEIGWEAQDESAKDYLRSEARAAVRATWGQLQLAMKEREQFGPAISVEHALGRVEKVFESALYDGPEVY